jgi:hypothetical protein
MNLRIVAKEVKSYSEHPDFIYQFTLSTQSGKEVVLKKDR